MIDILQHVVLGLAICWGYFMMINITTKGIPALVIYKLLPFVMATGAVILELYTFGFIIPALQ